MIEIPSVKESRLKELKEEFDKDPQGRKLSQIELVQLSKSFFSELSKNEYSKLSDVEQHKYDILEMYQPKEMVHVTNQDFVSGGKLTPEEVKEYGIDW